MSKISSHPERSTEALADILVLLGAEKHVPLERDYDEEYIAKVVNRMRGLLAKAVQEKNITLTELAKKLDVNRSLVTRFFNSQGDMKVSTLALVARALDKEWDIQLHDDRERKSGCNFAKSAQEETAINIHPVRTFVCGWQPTFALGCNENRPPRYWDVEQLQLQNSIARETEST